MSSARRFGLVWILTLLLAGFIGNPAEVWGQTGGISIDANGLVRDTLNTATPPTGPSRSEPGLERAGGDAQRPAGPRRIVSLLRYERACREWLGQQAPGCPPVREWPAELRWWGGLTRIDAVHYDRASGDVWVAGHAEDLPPETTGVRGNSSGERPRLDLDDWLVALRYAFPQGTTDDFIGVSIDPTAAGLTRFQQAVKQIGRGDVSVQRAALADALGPQQISLYGVDPRSQFALKLLAADYRLKRLALGHDPAPVPGFRSLPELLADGRVTGRFPQTRWWLTPGPGLLTVDRERTHWQIEGTRLLVQTNRVGEPEAADRRPAVPKAAREFAALTTRLFPQLASRHPAFGELTNLVSLSLVAELVRHFVWSASDAGTPPWRPTLWLDQGQAATGSGPLPQQVAPLIEIRRAAGVGWILCGSGGVEIRPEELLKTAEVRAGGEPAELPTWPADDSHWWHDVR